jgi:hypothetical protein
MSAVAITVSNFLTSKPSIAACSAQIDQFVTVTIDPAPLKQFLYLLPPQTITLLPLHQLHDELHCTFFTTVFIVKF